jgi:hypothetical protein
MQLTPEKLARRHRGWSTVDRPSTDSVLSSWDFDELDNVMNAAQMEWDPQSDIGSPMLPVHNLPDIEFIHPTH